MSLDRWPEIAAMLDWQGCYDDQWADLLVPEALAHPAKFSRGLITRIILHGLERGWWAKGDVIADPFGGVGTGGIVAAYNGLAWMGVELEAKFVELAEQNFALHRQKLEALDSPQPVIVQGDSRDFARIVGQAAGVLTSPPYISGGHHPDQTGSWGGLATEKGLGTKEVAGYGTTPGQIGKLPAGDVAAVISSPPYAETGSGGNMKSGAVDTTAWSDGRARKMGPSMMHPDGYGASDGQIGNLPAGKVEAVLMGRDSGDSYWKAMNAVYRQCLLALRPGGMLVVVMKDYAKERKRIRLCDQTFTLLQHIGFIPVERIHALLTKETEIPSLFGKPVVKVKKKASFFRRLYESKLPEGHECIINWEEVLCVRKPSNG